MNIFINLTSIFKGGAEQVAASFVDECRYFTEHTFHVFLGSNISEQLDIENFPSHITFYHFQERPGQSLSAYYRTMRALSGFEAKFNPDCVISTGGHGYWRPKAPLIAGFNIPHFVYPESPYFSEIPLKGRLIWWIKEKVHMRFYRRTDILFVQTEDVKERLKSKLSNNVPVKVISNTVNGHFLNPAKASNKLPVKGKNEVRLLMLSSYYPHKNHKIIVQIIQELIKNKTSKQFKFVVTLPKAQYDKLFSEVRDYVVNLGRVPIAECPGLYNECDFMFLPTFLECFSASYIEAMLMRKPILTSDLGFAHTVCKDAAVYFDPTSPANAADKIIELTADQQLQAELIQRGSSYAQEIGSPVKRAKNILELCEYAVQSKNNQN